jgi:hypothetical protein
MRTFYLLLLGACYASGLRAQDERLAIQQWQSQHPTTLLIASDRYNSLSDQERTALGTDYILFQDKITLQQLQQSDAALKSIQTGKNNATKDADLAFIKQWLGANQDVKLVPHSIFAAFSPEEQTPYLENSRCMILYGETLTVKDIELFEQH